MNPATGLKRLGFALLAVVAAGGALATAGHVLLSAETVRQQALSEIRSVTGLDPILRGPAEVSLFPSGSVTFNDVALGDARAGEVTRRICAKPGLERVTDASKVGLGRTDAIVRRRKTPK